MSPAIVPGHWSQPSATPSPQDTERAAADLLFGLASDYAAQWNDAERTLASVLGVIPIHPALSEVMVGSVYNRTLLFGQHHHTTKAGYTVDPDFVNRVNDASYPAAVEQVYRRYWRLPNSMFLNGWSCVYGTTADGFPIISRDTRLANFYHAVGLNGHGMTCHAGVAQAVAAAEAVEHQGRPAFRDPS